MKKHACSRFELLNYCLGLNVFIIFDLLFWCKLKDGQGCTAKLPEITRHLTVNLGRGGDSSVFCSSSTGSKILHCFFNLFQVFVWPWNESPLIRKPTLIWPHQLQRLLTAESKCPLITSRMRRFTTCWWVDTGGCCIIFLKMELKSIH